MTDPYELAAFLFRRDTGRLSTGMVPARITGAIIEWAPARGWSARGEARVGVPAAAWLAFLAGPMGSSGCRTPVFPRRNAASAPPAGTPADQGLRLRQLLDFAWRFHLGNAADPAQDFGFGVGEMFAKTGTLFLPSKPDFDDAAWRSVLEAAVEPIGEQDARMAHRVLGPLLASAGMEH